MSKTQLTANERHLLRLAKQGSGHDGWAPVSNVVWPLLARIPEQLLEREWPEGAEMGRCRLTVEGDAVMTWGCPA